VKLWFNWRFEGLEKIPSNGPAIIACNHISYLDPLSNAYAVVRAGRRPRFIAKQELFEIPLVGRVLSGARQIPVDRSRADNPEPLRSAIAAIETGEVVVVYPEGTVTANADSLPMHVKTGAVRLSLATRVPILPMASWGSQAVWQKSGKGSLKFGRPIWTKVGDPVDLSDRTGDAEDRAALREMADSLMATLTTLVVDLRGRYPARWA
jgi:1-acyl-sn-glycerol-3-phosphate acyltransferase